MLKHISEGNKKEVALYVANGAKITSYELEAALRSDSTGILHLVLASPTADPNQSMRWAIIHSSKSKIEVLLDHPKTLVTTSQNGILSLVCTTGRDDILLEVLSHPTCKPTRKEIKQIVETTILRNAKILEILLNNFTFKDNEYDQFLTVAVSYAVYPCLEILLHMHSNVSNTLLVDLLEKSLTSKYANIAKLILEKLSKDFTVTNKLVNVAVPDKEILNLIIDKCDTNSLYCILTSVIHFDDVDTYNRIYEILQEDIPNLLRVVCINNAINIAKTCNNLVCCKDENDCLLSLSLKAGYDQMVCSLLRNGQHCFNYSKLTRIAVQKECHSTASYLILSNVGLDNDTQLEIMRSSEEHLIKQAYFTLKIFHHSVVINAMKEKLYSSIKILKDVGGIDLSQCDYQLLRIAAQDPTDAGFKCLL